MTTQIVCHPANSGMDGEIISDAVDEVAPLVLNYKYSPEILQNGTLYYACSKESPNIIIGVVARSYRD